MSAPRQQRMGFFDDAANDRWLLSRFISPLNILRLETPKSARSTCNCILATPTPPELGPSRAGQGEKVYSASTWRGMYRLTVAEPGDSAI